MNYVTDKAYSALDEGLIPDVLVRKAINYLSNQRLKEISSESMEEAVEAKWKYIAALKQSAIAIEQARANEQHYEVPFSPSSLSLSSLSLHLATRAIV